MQATGLAMVDVFISYSRSDLAMVTRLARAVEAEGYAVWWDAELPPHQSYGDVITAKIEQTKAAIVVWSETAVKSEWVRAEADMARHHRKLVQTAIDDVMPPLPFNQIQYAKIGDWQGEPDHPGWRKVKVSLADLCGPRDGVVSPQPIPFPSTPPPRAFQEAQPQPQPVPVAPASPTASRWPLYAGIGVAVVGLAAAGGLLLGRQGSAPPEPRPAAPVTAVAPASAPVAVEPNAAPVAAAAEEPGDGGDAPPDAATAANDPYAAADTGGPLPKPNDADMTFADSSTRILAPSEVLSLGPSTLRVARNEIMARKGRRFRDPWLRDWFSRYAWYRPRFDEVPLTPIEKRNIALIRQAEARYQ